MKILGIDPGYDRLGIAVLDKPNRGDTGKKPEKETVIYSDCFQTSAKDTIYERLQDIGREISRIMDKYKPDRLAIETLFITKNQKTAMRVAEVRGIIIYEAGRRDIPVSEYAPMQIKMAVTSDGTSDKERMIRMIHMLISMPNKKALDDEYDAIAVSLACSAEVRN